MKITFLAHSGFLIELEGVLLLFDWWKGELPPLPQKPLVVMVSHHHPDHFDPRIFTLAQPGRQVRYLLGKDIRLSPGHKAQWGVTGAVEPLCKRVGGWRKEEPFPGVVVETLPSNDCGVAFLVTAEGKTIYHAGDLNLWQTKDQPEDLRREISRSFTEYTAPLKNRRIHLAMVPLDGHLGDCEDLGLLYLLEHAQIDAVLPMHQWEDDSPTRRFLAHHPQWKDRILPVSHEGQRFEI